jgi:hypothetical protein
MKSFIFKNIKGMKACYSTSEQISSSSSESSSVSSSSFHSTKCSLESWANNFSCNYNFLDVNTKFWISIFWCSTCCDVCYECKLSKVDQLLSQADATDTGISTLRAIVCNYGVAAPCELHHTWARVSLATINNAWSANNPWKYM